jgi:hypothetical protein
MCSKKYLSSLSPCYVKNVLYSIINHWIYKMYPQDLPDEVIFKFT